jgi:hypothetical protein
MDMCLLSLRGGALDVVDFREDTARIVELKHMDKQHGLDLAATVQTEIDPAPDIQDA